MFHVCVFVCAFVRACVRVWLGPAEQKGVMERGSFRRFFMFFILFVILFDIQ